MWVLPSHPLHLMQTLLEYCVEAEKNPRLFAKPGKGEQAWESGPV